MLLTIGMMVKNEEKHLEECLKALTPIREAIDSELVIVDTGSDDNTVKIAKQFTDKVYFHEWKDNFSEMRNTVISYAKGDWYFSLDGDEIINNYQGFIDFFKSGKYKKYNTALVTQKNYFDIENDRFSLLLVTRLFKNDEDFHFEGAIHNQPQYKKPLYELDTILNHYGYISSDEELMEKKFERTATILKQELEKNPKNIYYWYQLSRSYAMHKDYKKSLNAIINAYQLVQKKENKKKHINVFIQLTNMYLIEKRYGKAEEIAKRTINIKDNYIDIYYYLAESQYYLNKREESLESYKKYIELVNDYDNTDSKNDLSVADETIGGIDYAYKFVVNLCSDLEKDYDYALHIALRINGKEQIKEIIEPFIKICIKSRDYNYLKRFFIEKTKDTEEVRFHFLSYLENKRNELDTEVENEIINIFSSLKNHEDYILLNKVRKIIISKPNNMKNEKLKDINYEEKPGFYGDIIYYILNQDKSEIYKFLCPIKEKTLNKFIEYINEKYDDLAHLLFKILDDNTPDDITKLRIKKSFGRYLIALDDITIDRDDVIDKYLESGIKYIIRLYNKEIIENELTTELKSKEEAFLLFIYKGFAVKDSDLKTYIKYLRKAIDVYPLMKKVVETLMLEIKEEQNKINEKIKKEKNKLKNKIEILINQYNLTDAKKLIEEYELKFNKDADIYSMYGSISVYEGDLDSAKRILKEGLEIYNYSFDILYNLAFVFEEKEEYLEAHTSYILAKRNINDEKIKEELQKKIKDISKNTNLKNKNFSKEKVLLYGTGEGLDIIIENLNYRFEIVAYVDNQVKDEIDVEGIPLIPIDEIRNYDYDFIIITEKNNDKSLEYKNELKKINYIKNNKIYPYFRKKRQLIIEGFDHKMQNLITKSNIELIVTGMSYAEVGIDNKVFNEETINFALSSQDIFYDYQVLKYVLQFDNIKNNLKHVIINLAYFAFDYDMSRKISRNRVHRYYDYFNTTHNNDDRLSVKLLDAKYVKKMDRNSYTEMTQNKLNNIMDESTIKQTKNYAKYHSNMKHDGIVKENKKIFKNYLDLLKQYDINPTVVVFPVTNYYYDNFSYEIKDRFYKIINEFKNDYNFSILDYFDKDLFDNQDFWDGSHLNKIGAEKFTKILKSEIDILED